MSPIEIENQVIEGFRLSPQQKRLWLLQQDNPVYCVQAAILRQGNLKSETLQAALQQVINRHEILRTAFVRPQRITTPIQVIKASSQFLCQQIDLSTWESQQQLSRIDALLQQERFIPFDLERGVNLRCSLLKLSAHKYILIVTMPSICADSWTLKNLVQEISYFYNASVNEITEEEVVQYIQFSEWQNQLLEDTESISGLEYWQNPDLLLVETLKLPFELKSSQVVNKFNFHTVELQIPSHLLDKVEIITQQSHTDISTFFLACWYVIIYRFINQTDIIIGVGCDGRKYEELQTSCGLFAKYLPIHCQLQKNYSFSECLQILNTSLKNVEQWEEYFNWEQFAQFTGSKLDSCLLAFSFDFHQQAATYSAGEVSFSIEQDYACIEPFKLKLECVRAAEFVTAKLHYDVNCFCAEDIQRLARHLQTLIASAIALPSTKINQLEILSDRDRQQLLIEFNHTQVDIPQNQCIHQLFETQVTRTPNQIAVVYEQQQLTYTELNQRANQLAHYLQTMGVQPEVIVGIVVERSLDMIVGILGILKAGGAYLPIDPALPLEAIALRLQDAQVSLVITQTHLVEKLQQLHLQCVCWDDVPENESAANLDSGVTDTNLVYTIYTSGSTGNPKGVSIEHSSLVNYVNAILTRIELPSPAHFATVSTLAADLGNTVIFPSLCTGGCLHIISAERTTNPEALAAYCRSHPIDCLKIVPSHLEALLTAADPKAILPRQRLILGGETVSWELIEKVHQIAPNCVIFNHYGPTEATIGVTTFKINHPTNQLERLPGTVPLGSPLANTQIYLLDENLQPVPIYVPGEVYIGGHGVARHYLHQPELTAQKFISNPFSTQPETKLYQTGDLARWLSDGNIQFLGRIDNQVKLRGFRIEPDEIASVLCQHPKVQQAVVIAREDELGNICLVAYIVAKEAIASHSQLIIELRDFLRNKLPEYMIPAAIVLLKALPLTPNGKVNRRELPPPIDSDSKLETAFVAPRNHLELQITQIWEDILNIKPIGVTNNFFDLGGHSLLAVRLIAKLQQQFQQDIPLSSLFQAGTIEDLAGIITQQQQFVSSTGVIEIQPKGTKPPFFCVRPYGGNVLCYYHLARYLGTDQPFYGLQETRTLFEKPLQPYSQIADMANHHILSMRAVQPQGPYFLGGWSMGGVIAFEIANQLQSQGEQVALLALFDSKAPIANQITTNYQVEDDTKLLTELAIATAQSFGKELLLSAPEIQHMEAEEQLRYILQQMKEASLTSPDVTLEQIGYYLQVCRSDQQAIRNYQPQIYPHSITLFSTEDSQNFASKLTELAQGWRELSTQPVQVHFVPGDHQTMIALPHVQILAEQLKICLEHTQMENRGR
ncbi:non-ribosomal peptide synthetase [Fortiea contorta]|uniref:non-ribosomal peptide synthetase n=1 Tax=Fortiea contorta TaxID=1892405 RepID=UPI00034D8467|nr:non-ribosomal peptide synthetase [Fortiea contorta]